MSISFSKHVSKMVFRVIKRRLVKTSVTYIGRTENVTKMASFINLVSEMVTDSFKRRAPCTVFERRLFQMISSRRSAQSGFIGSER